MQTHERPRFPFQPDYAIPPGRTLKETIDHLGIAPTKLASWTRLPEPLIHQFINGDAELTPDTAIQLERATGLPAQTWNNLEENFRKQLARLERK